MMYRLAQLSIGPNDTSFRMPLMETSQVHIIVWLALVQNDAIPSAMFLRASTFFYVHTFHLVQR